jgi:DNA-binding CsgD family transcriptional regulator
MSRRKVARERDSAVLGSPRSFDRDPSTLPSRRGRRLHCRIGRGRKCGDLPRAEADRNAPGRRPRVRRAALADGTGLIRDKGEVETVQRTGRERRLRVRSAPHTDTQMLRMLADGHTIEVIARRLEVSERTVRRRLRVLADEAGVTTTIELVVHAVRHGII